MLNIGHRGAMGHVTENTLASIQKALDLKVDAIEIDVYVIKCGEVVVFHDDTLERLSNSNLNIEDLTLMQVKEITLIGNHSIPTLSEALDLINKKVLVNIELKGKNTALPTLQIIKNYIENKNWTEKDFLLSSFMWDELIVAREFNPTIAIALLSISNHINAIPLAHKLNAVAINPWFFTLTSHEVEEIKSHGFKIYTYTVNEINDIEKARRFGVDGIFCNFPERLH